MVYIAPPGTALLSGLLILRTWLTVVGTVTVMGGKTMKPYDIISDGNGALATTLTVLLCVLGGMPLMPCVSVYVVPDGALCS